MAGQEAFKQPPVGVPTAPDAARAYVPLIDAAKRLGLDRRTVLDGVTAGSIEGWAKPGLKQLRWYVYADGLPQHAENEDPGRSAGLVIALERENATLVADNDALAAENARLRSRLMNASEANMLLLAAHDDLSEAADRWRAAGDKYRQALGLYTTPDDLADLPPS